MNAAKKIILLLWLVIVASLGNVSALTPGASENRVWQKSFETLETRQAEPLQTLGGHQENESAGYDYAADSLLAADTGALVSRANEIHSALDPIAQEMRTTAVLDTSGGRIVAGGARDLTPAQRALLGPGETAARLPGAHAEVTALQHAAQNGLTPQGIGVTRIICPECEAAIRASGGTLTSPTTAVWPH